MFCCCLSLPSFSISLFFFFFLFKGITFNLLLKKIHFLHSRLLYKPMHSLELCSPLSCPIPILPFPITCFPLPLVPPPTACIPPALAQPPCPAPGLRALHTRPAPFPGPEVQMIRFSAQLRQAVSWLGQKRLALEGGKQALTGPGVPSALRWFCLLSSFVLLQEQGQGAAGGA